MEENDDADDDDVGVDDRDTELAGEAGAQTGSAAGCTPDVDGCGSSHVNGCSSSIVIKLLACSAICLVNSRSASSDRSIGGGGGISSGSSGGTGEYP
jgi:hypothetical protein